MNAEKASLAVRSIISLALLAIAVWAIYTVIQTLGIPPQKDPQGNILVDRYARANALLLVVLPLLTTALGYWFGAQGTAKAEERTQKAEERTQTVEERRQKESQQIKALLAEAPPDVFEKAKKRYPEAFEG